MASPKQNLLSRIPAVEILLQEVKLEGWAAGVPRRTLVDSVRTAVDQARTHLLKSTDDDADPEDLRRTILAEARKCVQSAVGPHYRKVINATGIILHTALGRAVIPAKALRQIEAELTGYSLLQVDIASGERCKRDGRIEELLKQLTGAEAATVVNNNAAATAIVLNTVARGKEVIVSRGQLVEIGGSFRLPDVMAASGVKLVEVGTTNKTHARDYENAITPETAAILRVHPSNYKISGFTAEVPLEELVRIGHQRGIAVIDDLGAGPLLDFSRFGFDKEPTLQESVQAGADLITASADKLIGASQAGHHPRPRRPDRGRSQEPPGPNCAGVGKLTLAVLEATLSLFLDESQALQRGAHACGCSAETWRKSPPRQSASPRRYAEKAPGAVVTTADGFLSDGQRFAADAESRRPASSRSGRKPSRRASLPRGSATTARRCLSASTKAKCWQTRARCWRARSTCWWKQL